MSTNIFFIKFQSNSRVCVIGACGSVGQALSLLLKRDDRVTVLSLYDVKKAIGMALDMSHIDTNSEVFGYEKIEMLPKALYCKSTNSVM